MTFNSIIFLVFLTIIFLVYLVIPAKMRNLYLLISSYLFYSYWDWRYSFLLFGFTLCIFVFGNLIFTSENISKKRLYLIISIILALGILCFFKYFNFFIEPIVTAFQKIGFNINYFHIKIFLPLGISYFIFQGLTYVIDIYRSQLKPEYSFINFALFVSFFPQITAGPIERAKNILPQIRDSLKPSLENFRISFLLITIGLFKKVLLGDNIGKIVNNIFNNPGNYSSLELIMALILYSFQIYIDFSGYSNIASGIAKYFGIDIMQNFRQPYFSKSIPEFWRRWHISLSSWFRDYVFLPLTFFVIRFQMKRKYLNKIKTERFGYIIGALVTMTLIGMWHGASLTFVLWGVLNGIYLIFSNITDKKRKKVYRKFNLLKTGYLSYQKRFLTYFLVLFGWLIFRSENIQSAYLIFKKLFVFDAGKNVIQCIFIIFISFSLLIILDLMEKKTPDFSYLSKIPSFIKYSFFAYIWILIISVLLYSPPLPFVYTQF